MRSFLQISFAFLVFILAAFCSTNSQAQVSRSKNKSSNPYRGSYQRFSSGSGGSATFEIRDGALYAWGSNAAGQLGDGTNIDRPSPVQIGTDNKWVSVACGGSHTIALKSNGTLWAWGYNFYGGLGDSTNAGRNTPVQIGADTTWISIAAGAAHTIALKSNGTLWAWGYNNNGQLGDSTTTDKNIPVQIGTDNKWVSIISGAYFNLGVKSNGTLWAWGNNTYGQLGDSTTTNRIVPTQIGADNAWVSVASGQYHSLALKSNGTLWTWGDNTYGELGDSTITNRISPIQIGTDNKWVSIAAGGSHSIALKSNGTLWAWGLNNNSQLGDGTTANRIIPAQMGADNKWVSIAGGYLFTTALKCDGTLWAWGDNSNGQLGDGTIVSKATPLQVRTDPRNWLQVMTGTGRTMAIKSDGTLWTWGYNIYGSLGDGTRNSTKLIPAQIGTDDKWISVAGGFDHTIALKSDGTLWAWGYNFMGQLGDGTNINKVAPVQIGTDTKWVSVVCGANHTMALKSDGTLWGWGDNRSNQLGDSTNINKNIPIQIGTDSRWVSVAGGFSNTVGLKSNGTLWEWGRPDNYNLNNSRVIPYQLYTDTDWVNIICGDDHLAVLKSNGTLWTERNNIYGQLGDGTTINRYYNITQIGTDTKWIRLAAGGIGQTIALKSDGALWAWGDNSRGQLGDGTTLSKTTPTLINSQGNVTVLASGGFGNDHSAIIKADRSSICLTGLNVFGQLGNGTTIVIDSNYNCSNSVCRQYMLVTAAGSSYTQALTGVANRTDFQAACALSAAIISSGTLPVSGNVTIQTFIDSSVQSYNGQPYVQRHYDILPSAGANTATATIVLYFTQAEFTAYNTAAGTSVPKLPSGPFDVTGIANLRVVQYHGTPVGGYAPGNYLTTWGGSGPAQISINPADSNIVWNDRDSRWEVTFDITGFSGFFVSTGNITVLPVKLLSFTAYKADAQRNRIVWETAIETPGILFTVERSSDGRTFTSIGNVTGKGTTGRYNFDDEQPLNNVAYYRLRITDSDGETTYSHIAVLSSGEHSGSITVAPVPASHTIIVTNTNTALNGTSATVSDMQGRIIYRFMLNGTGTMNIDVSKWTAGIYTLKLASGEAIRMVKQ